MRFHTLPSLLLVILFFSFHARAGALPTQRYQYTETTGTDSCLLFWEMEEGPEVTVRARKNDVSFLNVCDRSGATHTWEMHSPDTDLCGRRTGNAIRLEGVVAGKHVKKQFSVDGLPWYQPLTYCLRALVTSGRRETAFWMIRLDTFRPVKLKAVKKDVQQLIIDGTHVEAQRVRVCPVGILSPFWHGDYWYRLSDGLFLKYHGRNGPPGSDTTTIRMNKTN